MKKVNRGWLKRQVDAGNIEAKCNHRFTDDYAFDNAYNFGKTDWMPARISRPVYEPYTTQCGNESHRCTNHDEISGHMNFSEQDFKYSTGFAYYDDDADRKGEIHFVVMSSESYQLRMKQC